MLHSVRHWDQYCVSLPIQSPLIDSFFVFYLRFAAELGQRAHLLLEAREEHVSENLGDLEDVCADWSKLIDAETLTCGLTENFVNTLIELSDTSLVNGLPLRKIELRY